MKYSVERSNVCVYGMLGVRESDKGGEMQGLAFLRQWGSPNLWLLLLNGFCTLYCLSKWCEYFSSELISGSENFFKRPFVALSNRTSAHP